MNTGFNEPNGFGMVGGGAYKNVADYLTAVATKCGRRNNVKQFMESNQIIYLNALEHVLLYKCMSNAEVAKFYMNDADVDCIKDLRKYSIYKNLRDFLNNHHSVYGNFHKNELNYNEYKFIYNVGHSKNINKSLIDYQQLPRVESK